MELEFKKQVNNEIEYLTFILKNNFNNFEITELVNNQLGYVYLDEEQTRVVRALDYTPPFPCEITLVGLQAEDDNPRVTMRVLRVKPL